MKIHFLNLPREICQRLLGKHHTHTHRMIVGIVVMTIGVTVAKSGAHFHTVFLLEYGLDVIGYSFHGLGLVPFIEHLLEEENL